MNPFVSIIMPAYNCEPFLRESVESVLCQTYKNWELILIDDASTDQTWALMNELSKGHPNIRLYHNSQNLGVGQTRNLGVTFAAGEWIAFLDSDDLWDKDKLKKQIRLLLQTPGADLLFTGSAFILSDGTPVSYTLHVPEQISFRELLKQNLVSCSSVLVKKKYMQKYPMSSKNDMHEDFAVWLQILKEDSFAYGIDEPLLIYRISSGSKSANKWKAARMNWCTYRYVGLSLCQSIYYMLWYTIRGVLKYRKINGGKS